MHGSGPPLGGGSRRFVSYEERFVSNDRGNRVVNIFLRDTLGHLLLAVVGTERSRRHMVYSVCDDFLPISGLDKSTTWRSRREVTDWIASFVSKSASSSPTGSDSQFPGSPPLSEDLDDEEAHHSRDVHWVGPLWTCRKRLKHFNSFRRNGITIAVRSFVYVMSEGKEHHIAYIEDMYEDKKSRKKLRVRWFHKTNELACKIPPPAPHPREVFFTPFQQVISVECVDGLTTVMSPEHFERCLGVFTSDSLELIHPCSRQFDSAEGVKHFNISEVEGYWCQRALGVLGVSESGSEDGDDGEDDEDEVEEEGGFLAASAAMNSRYTSRRVKGHSNSSTDTEGGNGGGLSDAELWRGLFEVGDKVEVLCQDSALRGCWFKAQVIGRDSRRVRVRYEDLQDEEGKESLEEWVPTTRFAPSDKLNIHALRRLTIRPCPPATSIPVPCSFGSPVDVWWNDGWWEGVIISRYSGNEVRVYFPDEGDTSSFGISELRPSRDWVNGQWRSLKPNSETVSALDFGDLCGSSTKPIIGLQSCRYARQIVDATEQDEIEQQLLRIAEAAEEAGSRQLQLEQQEDDGDKYNHPARPGPAGKRGSEAAFDSCKCSKEVNAEDGASEMELENWMSNSSENCGSSKKSKLNNNNAASNNNSSSTIHNSGMVFSSSLPPLVLSR